ncbi:hypothetical protein BH24ACT21_BH24ACT21_08730 [soil metagenome]|jgi:hypothetical protein
MGWLRIVIFLLLAVLMGFLFVSHVSALVEGSFLFGFLGVITSILSACVLLLAALRWDSDPTEQLIRIYAICLGGMIVAGGLVGLAMTAFGLGGFTLGETFTTVAILVVITAASSLLFFGALVWRGRYAVISRRVGWVVLLASCVPLVSFASILLPLIVGATPTLIDR